MLTADYLDVLPDPIVALYREYEQSVINDIARRLARADMTETAAWQMQRLTESGLVYEEALNQLANLTGKSDAELKTAFEQAGVKAMKFDDAVYKAAGLNPLPLNLSPAMAQVLAAGLRKTQGVMRNLTMTTAISGQEAFTSAADLAYMQVSSGAMSYNQAIREAIKDVASKGLSTINFANGRHDQLDVAVRRSVLTGVAQTTGQMQWARADEMGCDLVQTTAHAGARPTHQVWQGKVFSRSGRDTEYPPFVESTDYGSVTGLMGANCRHHFYPFFKGISENAYRQATLDDMANKTVTYEGEKMSQYDASQMQRGIERKIRYWKRQASALEAAGLDNTGEVAQVKAWQAKMRGFVKQTGLRRQSEREQVLSNAHSSKNIKTAPSLSDIQNLPVDKVLEIGELDRDVVSAWTNQVDGNTTIILTGKQRDHYLKRHEEMRPHEGRLIDAVLSPDEVHRNKKDMMMAIFYKEIDPDHYFRAAVLLQQSPGNLKHSILSYRIAGIEEVLDGRKNGRVAWRK